MKDTFQNDSQQKIKYNQVQTTNMSIPIYFIYFTKEVKETIPSLQNKKAMDPNGIYIKEFSDPFLET